MDKDFVKYIFSTVSKNLSVITSSKNTLCLFLIYKLTLAKIVNLHFWIPESPFIRILGNFSFIQPDRLCLTGYTLWT